MPFKLLRVAALAVLGLSACATPYGKEGLTGGYSEKQLSPDIWRVTFGGNGFTTQETVQTFWLYRSANLTLEQGFQGFKILSDMRFSAAEANSNICHGSAPVYVPIYTGGGPTGFNMSGDIQLLKAPVDHKPPKVFDAQRLKDEIEPYINGKKCANLLTGNEGSGNVCPHVHTYLFPDGEKPQ